MLNSVDLPVRMRAGERMYGWIKVQRFFVSQSIFAMLRVFCFFFSLSVPLLTHPALFSRKNVVIFWFLNMNTSSTLFHIYVPSIIYSMYDHKWTKKNISTVALFYILAYIYLSSDAGNHFILSTIYTMRTMYWLK